MWAPRHLDATAIAASTVLRLTTFSGSAGSAVFGFFFGCCSSSDESVRSWGFASARFKFAAARAVARGGLVVVAAVEDVAFLASRRRGRRRRRRLAVRGAAVEDVAFPAPRRRRGRRRRRRALRLVVREREVDGGHSYG